MIMYQTPAACPAPFPFYAVYAPSKPIHIQSILISYSIHLVTPLVALPCISLAYRPVSKPSFTPENKDATHL
jgi:hypothetical protein